MPNKAFFEITNACNLSCSFCHGTRRRIRFVTEREFETAAVKLRPFCDYLYFHLMGEPLLHPLLPRFFDIAFELGFKVIITTNGTLLKDRGDVLLGAKSLHKVSVSLHAYEANALPCSVDEYLKDCFKFCSAAADKGIISVMRLWNVGGKESLNDHIINEMHAFFDGEDYREWQSIYSGYKLKDKVFLEWGKRFTWPDVEGEYFGSEHSCYGLRDQIGVLSDGTVVPCCLDAEGAIALGNIYTEELTYILSTPRALSLRSSFEKRCVKEPLCQRCGYAYGK